MTLCHTALTYFYQVLLNISAHFHYVRVSLC